MTPWYDRSPDAPCFDGACRCSPLERPFSSSALPADCGSTTAILPGTLTYPAAKVATHFHWNIDETDARLLDASRRFIALTLGDAMIAMMDLRWITLPKCTVNWSAIPICERVAANDVRVFLDLDGKAYRDAFPTA